MNNLTAGNRSASRSTPPRVLVVDDEAWLCAIETTLLEHHGCVVETASDGQTALELLASHRFDVVLTDRQMPVLDGDQLVLALRAAGHAVPVVMLSGSPAPVPSPVARELSALLRKPCRIPELLAAVFSALPVLEFAGRCTL